MKKECTEPTYDTPNCMRSIKKKYWWVPMFVIKRVLYAEELYMKKVGIIDYEPTLDWWSL